MLHQDLTCLLKTHDPAVFYESAPYVMSMISCHMLCGTQFRTCPDFMK